MAGEIFRNFAAGMGQGRQIGQDYRQKKADKAMGALYEHANNPDAMAQETDQEAAMSPHGDKKLPSTRDWVNLRAEALKTAAEAGGADAVAKAHENIDAMQHKGFTQNLMTARQLIEQGRHAEAQQYLEKGASYKPDFSVLVAAPARLSDGSTELMGYVADEQSGQQRSPCMMLTTDFIDKALEMYGSDPAKFVQNNWDRKMAEQKAGLDEYRWQAGQEEKEWRRGFDVAEARRKGESKPVAYKSKDYNDTMKAVFSDYEDPIEGGGLPPKVKQQVRTLVAKARQGKLKALAPDILIPRIVEEVMKKQGGA